MFYLPVLPGPPAPPLSPAPPCWPYINYNSNIRGILDSLFWLSNIYELIYLFIVRKSSAVQYFVWRKPLLFICQTEINWLVKQRSCEKPLWTWLAYSSQCFCLKKWSIAIEHFNKLRTIFSRCATWVGASIFVTLHATLHTVLHCVSLVVCHMSLTPGSKFSTLQVFPLIRRYFLFSTLMVLNTLGPAGPVRPTIPFFARFALLRSKETNKISSSEAY